MTTKSHIPAKLVGPANPAPSMAAHCGTQPDMRAMAAKVPTAPGLLPAAAKCRESSPSWMRWPPPSSRSTNGWPCSRASWVARACFSPPFLPLEPPYMVKSKDTTDAGRPSMSTVPVTTPSPGASRSSVKAVSRAGSMRDPNSTKLPGSASAVTRSRAVSLPRACCLATASGRDPSRPRARLASTRSSSASSSSALIGRPPFGRPHRGCAGRRGRSPARGSPPPRHRWR